MSDPIKRHVLVTTAMQADILGDVLCVEMRGRFTVPRVRACLERLRRATERADYGALLVNTVQALVQVGADELADLWRREGCPLAAKPCALVYDANQGGAAEFCEELGLVLATGQPARVMGAFAGSREQAAREWAARQAQGHRLEHARRMAKQASSPGSSDTPGQTRGRGPGRS